LLCTLQSNVDPDTMMPLNTLTPDVISWCRSFGRSAETVSDVINDVALNDAIQKGIDDVNRKAMSNVERIQKFVVLPTDFSVAGEELGW
jgi:long-subunit acyl-CoA synthetase (AMP-forming)